MISFNNIVLDFGGFRLFDEISFLVNKTDRLGLVGRNGSGKTTLLKMIVGKTKPSSGKIEKQNDLNTGYLPQEKIFKNDFTVFQEAILAFEKEIELKEKINQLQIRLESNQITSQEELETSFSQLSELSEQFAILDGNNIEMKTERVLMGLGFESSDFQKKVSTFSEGWQMRVELAKILLKKTDILLLDEPTNHLDIESIQWLEDYLLSYKGAIILISHDRIFLDKLTNRTVEINFSKIFDYPVSYSNYLELRDERIELQKRQQSTQQKEIEQIEKFISRFRYKASKAKQVQSKIKLLENKESVKIDEINISEVSFSFPECRSSGKIVLEAEKISKTYDEKKVIEDANFIISNGDKIAFIGKNGQGKTTLSKIIVGELLHEGTIKLGYNVEMGYFPQNAGKELDSNKTVLEMAELKAHADFRGKVRTILGNFLFKGDDVYKKVNVLSGGEKSRLALAILLCKPTNFLILDEPTNHLDMLTKEILKYALLKYKGTLIIVSHDRDFLDGLTNHVYYFNNKIIKKLPGTVSEFLHIKRINDLKILEQKETIKAQNNLTPKLSTNKEEWQQKKIVEKENKKLKNKLATIELKIEKLENEISELDKNISKFHENMNENNINIFNVYSDKQKKLANMMTEWEQLLETINNS